MKYEDEWTEFKSLWTDDIYKTIIAFANTKGGNIYVGIDDEGNEIGVPDFDKTYLSITNGIRDAISPDVTVYVSYGRLDNNVIKINVSEGGHKPYYLKSKGLKPSGVFIRQGASTCQASEDQIRFLIKESDKDIFEREISNNQFLHFDYAKEFLSHYDIEFSEEKYRVLGVYNENNQFTNLAKIISDECEHTIKVAVFSDLENLVFQDRKEFKGSLFKSLKETLDYILWTNKTASKIEGLYRVDQKDYPEDVLREALLNSVIHRDYSLSGSIIININKNQTEFINFGGLMPGVSKEDILSGVSQLRNPNLANIFFRIKLIEAYGTGLRRIFNYYEQKPRKPEIIITPNTFKLILPNMNENEPQVTGQYKKILDYIKEKGSVTRKETEDLLKIKSTRAYNILREMTENKQIKSVPVGREKKYVIN